MGGRRQTPKLVSAPADLLQPEPKLADGMVPVRFSAKYIAAVTVMTAKKSVLSLKNFFMLTPPPRLFTSLIAFLQIEIAGPILAGFGGGRRTNATSPDGRVSPCNSLISLQANLIDQINIIGSPQPLLAKKGASLRQLRSSFGRGDWAMRPPNTGHPIQSLTKNASASLPCRKPIARATCSMTMVRKNPITTRNAIPTSEFRN
jgi:hypothetical protein